MKFVKSLRPAGVAAMLLAASATVFLGATPANAANCNYADSGSIVSGNITNTVNSTDDRSYSSTEWNDLECGVPHAVKLLPGQNSLITVGVSGAVACVGMTNQYCEARVLVGGVEALPASSPEDPYEWAAPDTSGQYASHAFTRTVVVNCPLLISGPLGLPLPNLKGCEASVVAQVKNRGSVIAVDSLSVTASSQSSILPPLLTLPPIL